MISFTWFCCGFIFYSFLIIYLSMICISISAHHQGGSAIQLAASLGLSSVVLGATLKVFIFIELLGVFNISQFFDMPLV